MSAGFVCQSKQACAKGYGSDLFSERADSGEEVCPPGSLSRAAAESSAAAAAGRVLKATKGAPPPGSAGDDEDKRGLKGRIGDGVKGVLAYEDTVLQAKALAVLPGEGVDGGGVRKRGREMAAAGAFSQEEGLARALLR